MKKLTVALCLMASLASTGSAYAKEKISLMLDWFVNPDHAALIVAQQKGYFDKYDLEVEIIEPADPSLAPKLVASGDVDMAVDYQPQLQLQVAEGLPVVRIGTLISSPLTSLVVLKSGNINQLSDLKGKKVGYSVTGFESTILDMMLQSSGVTKDDVELVNVNFSLSPSLLSGQVDAVIGAYRNFELNQLKLEKNEGLAFYPEEHGVPAYDELILTANTKNISDKKFSDFLSALEEATIFTLNHPDEAWEAFVSYKPNELGDELNQMAWKDTLPRLALRPRALDAHRYQAMAEFMQAQGLIKTVPELKNYAVELQ
ncbi:ABC transporter substrate-binding protein [Otariodibacter oris]|uniref:Putative hydroxymethylpyrimidine transport system substrate-binding protein n=1 Tax=Otariodibacter oris TaxID=1032623 RepID=A0A420XIY3_9PAST|nr:thiamine biosynthesis protein [Otariodibacter oris]RKR77193.1 putative hydroxymethylpyrimidine transport system substrate-binding protein [Otariodibacter oris]